MIVKFKKEKSIIISNTDYVLYFCMIDIKLLV